MEKLYFTGHETFYCRNYWLKKGLDHIWDDHSFNDEAVVQLGVGKNMVSAIRFWLRAFGLVDENDQPEELAKVLFGTEKGLDPYCEDIGTIWLLHYLLVKTKRSSIYHLVFNEFRKQRIEFQRKHLINFLENYCEKWEGSGGAPHSSSIKRDVGVFISNYSKPANSKSIEDDFSGLLFELDLVQQLEKSDEWYKIENKSRIDLPPEIVLFCILSNDKYGQAVTLHELLTDTDSVGSVFALSANGLMEKINAILAQYPQIVFTDDGGVRVLQFKEKVDRWKVLNNYYGN